MLLLNRRIGAAVCAAATALTLAACGGNTTTAGSSSSGGASAANTSASSGSAASSSGDLAAQGKDLATKAGAPMALATKTIGYVNYGATGLAAQRAQAGAQAAADALKWKLLPCDGQGSPQVQATCATNLINQGVDALMLNTIGQATVTSAIQAAKTKGIPVINVGGDAGQKDLETASYYPPEPTMGKALADYFVKTLGSAKASILMQSFGGDWAMQRDQALKDAVAANSNLSIASTFDADGANLVPGTQQQVSALLNQYPQAKAIWIVFSSAELGAYQALATKYPGKTYPDRPLLATFYANLPAIDMIRKGQLDAAVEDSLEWCSWVAMDQLAENFARKTAPSTDAQPNYGTGLDFWRPVVVTKDNLPADGSLATPPVDYVSLFDAKWKAEFTNLAS